MGRTILVGDIHGCPDELSALMKICAPGEDDHVVSVGDLLAKGPDSRGVLALARTWGMAAVLGNHDAHVLAQLDRDPEDVPRGRGEHHKLAQTLAAEEVAWLEALPPWRRYHRAARGHGGAPLDVLVVHGGLVPGVPLEAQDRNMLLNLRSVRADGTPSKRIEGTPWAALWRGPELVVFGHDARRGLQEHPLAVGLDTGCVYGGRLTALILPERRLVSVPARRAYADFD